MKNLLDYKKRIINSYFNKDIVINNDIVLIKNTLSKETMSILNKDISLIKDWNTVFVKDEQIKKETTKIHFIKNTEVDNKLFETTKEILEIYSIFYPEIKNLINGDQGYRYNFYFNGTGYYHHIDCSKLSPVFRERVVSCVIQLNSDYEGGVLEFPNQNFRVKLGQGDVILFPSIHTHPHTVHPVTNGQRKNVVTWFV